jgi:ornithine decarboxylase
MWKWKNKMASSIKLAEKLLVQELSEVSPNVAASRTKQISRKLEQFLLTRHATPYLAMDLDIVNEKYRELESYFPDASIFYAVKANPRNEIVAHLTKLGANFDVASTVELDGCLASGVAPEHISYGNTIKKSGDIAYAYSRGVRLFVFDSEAELLKLAVHAPGSNVMCRVLTSGKNAAWPLSRKFGCDVEMAAELLQLTRKLGLCAKGIGFHVGSQQMDPNQWHQPLQETARLFRQMSRHKIDLDTVNIGGGFPVPYNSDVAPLRAYERAIRNALEAAFGNSQPQLMLEPGRSLVAEAGVIQAEVVLISKKSKHDEVRWVYLDSGKFGGLAETMDESIQYRLRTSRTGAMGPVILAGPTCDSADILSEQPGYHLPIDLACGDRIEILNTGAYTSSYSSVGFNGFAPLKMFCL